MADWYDNAKDMLMLNISKQAGISRPKVRHVYSILVNMGFIDYDVEKETLWEHYVDE